MTDSPLPDRVVTLLYIGPFLRPFTKFTKRSQFSIPSINFSTSDHEPILFIREHPENELFLVAGQFIEP